LNFLCTGTAQIWGEVRNSTKFDRNWPVKRSKIWSGWVPTLGFVRTLFERCSYNTPSRLSPGHSYTNKVRTWTLLGTRMVSNCHVMIFPWWYLS